jgi:hypothetical protein
VEEANFQVKLDKLTRAIDHASDLVARNMDLALEMSGAIVNVPIINDKAEWFETKQSLTSIQDIVANKAGHLDHVHVYSGRSEAGAETLSMHTDAGLFIAIVPGMYIDSDGNGVIAAS